MKVIFRGGLEDNVRHETFYLSVDSLSEPTVKGLIQYIEKNEVKEGYKHFSTNSELEGGILCVINEFDWDVLDREKTVLQDENTVHFITTMHGG